MLVYITQWVNISHWPTDLAVHDQRPDRGGNVFNRKRVPLHKPFIVIPLLS